MRNISLALDEGEALGIVGESGSGKSLTLRALLGVLPAGTGIAAGSISFRGAHVVQDGHVTPAMRALRGRGIGMVFQDPTSALDPVMRVGEQIGEGLRRHGGLNRKAAAERAIELMDRLGIPEAGRRSTQFPHEFSGGMRQRVMIAMAIACGPSILLCDKPTTALDVTTQREILELFSELRRETRLSLVFVSHDLGVIAATCDRVAVMYCGEIVETGTLADVFSAPHHPYTRGLLEAAPDIEAESPSLRAIMGEPPDPLDPPAGCSFHARCPIALDTCRAGAFPLRSTGAGRQSSCVRHGADCVRHRRGPGDGTRMSEPVLEVRSLTVDFAHRAGHLGAPGRTTAHSTTSASAPPEARSSASSASPGRVSRPSARALPACTQPPRGRYAFTGRRFRRGGRRSSARAIQIVFQIPTPPSIRGAGIGSVLEEAVRAHRTISSTDATRSARELLTTVGLPQRLADARPAKLSGGQRQRVAIARALAVDPEIVLADEVTSALDVSVQAVIVDLLGRLTAEREMTLVFVTHNLQVVRALCNRICVMHAGRIVETAPTEGIFASPRHPYTRALLEAVPRLHAPATANSTVQSPTSDSVARDGCAYRHRCPLARAQCAEEVPMLLPVDDPRGRGRSRVMRSPVAGVREFRSCGG